MFWLLVSIMGLMVGWSMMNNSMVNWCMDSVVYCWSMVNNWGMMDNWSMDSVVYCWGMVNDWSMVNHWSVHSSRSRSHKGSTCKSSKWDCWASSCQSDKGCKNKDL